LNSLIVFRSNITDAVCISYLDEHQWARNITSTFEERVAQGKAHSFTNAITLPVGGSGNSQSRQRGMWEVAVVKLGEKVRGHLCSQGIDVLRGSHCVERRPID